MDEFDSSFVSGKYVAIISINSSATKYFGPEMISNMNDKDHLVGQLTTPKHTCAWKTWRIFFRARQQFHQLKESSHKPAFLNQWTRLIFENQHQACLKTGQYCAQFLAGNMIDIEIRRRKTKSGR